MQATISKLESEVLSLRMQLREAAAKAESTVKAEYAAGEESKACTQAA